MEKIDHRTRFDTLQKEWETIQEMQNHKIQVYDAVLEDSPLGWWDWNIHENSVSISSSFKKMLGYEDNEIQNKPDSLRKLIHSDDFPKALRAFNKHVNTKGKFRFDKQLRYHHKDGHIVWAYSRGKVIQWDENGNPKRMVGSSVDITQLKQTEEKLNKSKEDLLEAIYRLKISTQSAKVGIWDWNVNKNELVWDDIMYKLYGITSDTFSGAYEAWVNCVHPDDAQHTTDEVEQALRKIKDYNTVFRVVWPDQSIHYIKARGVVEFDITGEPIRMIGTNWDITKEREMEREKIRTNQLETKNKELEQFVYVASHDLQEPLQTISSYSEILRKTCSRFLDDKSKKYFDYVLHSSSHMNELIKGLLDYSRLGRDQLLMKVDCQKLVEDIIEDLAGTISQSKASLVTKNLPIIYANKTELRQLFQNLISNGIKFQKPDLIPEIIIEAKHKKDHYLFSVKDNGIGLDSKYKERIFLIFQRLHTASEYNGTGIGLAQCKKIVEILDGKIWVESTPKTGSVFYFTIPIHKK